jgi:ribosomal protein L7/L12
MNYYAKAIDILYECNETLLFQLIKEVAKINPSVIVKAYTALNKKPITEQSTSYLETGRYIQAIKKYRELTPYLETGRYIQAIKKYRELTGAGLKEAKAFVDNLRIEMGLTNN